MAIDPSIALGVKPLELADPLAQYGKIAAIQHAQNQNALAQYQLASAQREEASQNALSRAYQAAFSPETGDYDVSRLRGEVIRAGAGAKLPALEKTLSELRTQQLTQKKLSGEVLDKELVRAREGLAGINPADPNAPAQFLAWHRANHTNPVLGPWLASQGITPQQSQARIEAAIASGPQAFAQLLNESRFGIEKAAELNKPIAVGGSLMTPQGQVIGTAPRQPSLLTPEEEAQKVRIAVAGRAPRAEPTPAAPVAVLDPASGQMVYVSREEAISKRMTPASQAPTLAPKDIQKREAAYPQATSAIKGFETNADSLVTDLQALLNDPGLEQITGPIYGRTPSVSREGSRAQALYDKIQAKGGFQALQALRDASKTGGALGNVSNQEGKQLQASFAAIDRRQNSEDVREALRRAISDAQGAKVRMREAYDETYSYRESRPGKTELPALSGEDKQALEWANANPSDPRAAKIKQKLGVK